MALNVLRGRGKNVPVMPEPLAIGEVERDIFSCPVCARPLAQGAAHCPGCGTRLLMGVPARRASVFLSVGVLVGMVLGGTVGATAVAVGTVRSDVGTGVNGAITPTAAPPRATSAPVAPPPGGATPIARSALGQVGALHARMVTGAALLETSLAKSPIDVTDVAKVLRSLAADAAYGSDLAPRVGAWDDAEVLSAQLVQFYDLVRQTARDGLSASLTDGEAYRGAGQAMLGVLTGITVVDAEARALAEKADVEMPPLVQPAPAAAP